MEAFFRHRMKYLGRIWQTRYFWSSLVANDLRNRYRRSFLGIGWSLVRPLSMTAIFCVVFGKLFNLSVAEYAPYLLIGITIWQFLTECITGGCHTFLISSAYIRQQQVPLAIFPLRTVLGAGFHTVIALMMSLLLIVFLKGLDDPLPLLALVPALILLFFLGWFLAILSGIMHAHFPDTQHLLEICLQILFYLTPVIYRMEDLSNRGRLVWFLEMNPLTALLNLFRTPVVNGMFPAWHQFQVVLLLVMSIGLVACWCLKKMERTLVFWI